MQTTWRRIDVASEREERIAAAQERLRRRRRHAEQTDSPAIAVASGEIWTLEGIDGGENLVLWVRHEGSRTHLADLLAPGLDADEIWRQVHALAVAQGWSRVSFSAYRGDEVAARLAEASGAQRVATKMQQETEGVPLPQGIATTPMSESEYAAYAARSDRSYAEELLASGAVADLGEALAEAAAAMSRLMPQGLQTPDQHLWTVRDPDDETVGVLWVHLQPERAFIYDIEMRDAVRGRGYGTQALRAAAAHARDAGRRLIALNVFGHNDGARRLYAREGYIATEVSWTAIVD